MELTLDELIPASYDDILNDVLDHAHTYYQLGGGRGSCKSTFVGFIIPILLGMHPDVHALCLRKTANTLADSCYAQLQFCITKLGLEDVWKSTKNPLKMENRYTGQTILFRGCDGKDDRYKLKSIKVPFGYIGVLWFEEADTFAGMEEIRSIQQSTMRGGDKYWTFYSYNPPRSNANFMNKEALLPRPDRLYHHSDYRSVPKEWLGEQFFIDAMVLKKQNPRAYEHEYLGIPTGTGGEVFDNLTIREITEEEVNSMGSWYYGLDFGWYPDPAHFTACAYDSNRRKLYIVDEFRVNKMPNEELWEEIARRMPEDEMLIADSAEPKSIADFRSYGANCRGAIKGKDSVRYSMKWLQSLTEIVIDPNRCPHTAEEFSLYEYEKTPNGEVTGAFPDANNHSIDAVRYAMNNVWKRRGE